MCTLPETGGANKPYVKRTCRLWQPTQDIWVMTLTHFFKRKAAEDTHYFVKAIPSDWGRAFEVKHLDADGGEAFHVNLTSDGPTCDCKGFQAHSHCKHAESLTALDAKGRLAPIKPPAEAKPAAKPALAPAAKPASAAPRLVPVVAASDGWCDL
jgi:hypothetical protein